MVLPDDDLFDLIQQVLHFWSGYRRRLAIVATRRCALEAFIRHSGFSPTARAAFSMGTANPMPANTWAPDGLARAVTMPTTSPSRLTSGPPELPGFTAASNWIRLVIWTPSSLRSGSTNSRFRPAITPAETDGPMPKGKPTATTVSPGLRPPVEAKVAGLRSSGAVFALITARSFSGCTLTTSASDLLPSQKVTTQRSVEWMTCRLVRMSPAASITTPLPVASGLSSLPSEACGGTGLRLLSFLAAAASALASWAACSGDRNPSTRTTEGATV